MEEIVAKKRMLSGIKPSGDLTLGSYLGAVKNWAERTSISRHSARRVEMSFFIMMCFPSFLRVE